MGKAHAPAPCWNCVRSQAAHQTGNHQTRPLHTHAGPARTGWADQGQAARLPHLLGAAAVLEVLLPLVPPLLLCAIGVEALRPLVCPFDAAACGERAAILRCSARANPCWVQVPAAGNTAQHTCTVGKAAAFPFPQLNHPARPSGAKASAEPAEPGSSGLTCAVVRLAPLFVPDIAALAPPLVRPLLRAAGRPILFSPLLLPLVALQGGYTCCFG